MKAQAPILADLVPTFVAISLMAFGGANAVVPEMHRQAVELRHWMSDAQFADLFALAQAAPGPNVMISTLIGWKVAGIAGALAATVAMCGPTCVIAYFAAEVWDRHRQARWRAAVGAGLAPLTVGLVAASAWLLSHGADREWRLAAITVATAVGGFFTRLNPLWFLAAAAALGISGLLG